MRDQVSRIDNLSGVQMNRVVLLPQNEESNLFHIGQSMLRFVCSRLEASEVV